MELRQYWQIVYRRWWIIVALLLIVLLASLLVQPTRAPLYVASMRFMMGLEPEAKTGDYYTYDKYYTWLTAEYLVDDVSELVRSGAFAQAVSQQLEATGIAVPAGAIHGSTQAGTLHRILTVSVLWGDAGQLAQVANAVVAVLPSEIAKHFAQVGTSGVYASLIDPPSIAGVGASLREKMDIPIRILLALVAGIAIALVLDYLDDSVRNSDELENAGVTVLAEIPRVRSHLLDLAQALGSLRGPSRPTGPGLAPSQDDGTEVAPTGRRTP
jgi:capsular polysaccharide biosynthesis protein